MGNARSTSRRCRGDQGAAIVEFALVAPILVLLVTGIFEFGFAWHSANIVERAVQNAARTASNGGDARLSDYDALRAVDATLAGADALDVKRVIIWETDNPNGNVPAACMSITSPIGTGPFGSSGSECTVYSPQQVAQTNPLAGFGGPNDTSCSGDWDVNWCPLNRDNTRPVSDYLGLYIEADYENVTGLLPVNFTIERKAVFLLEPPTVGS